MRFKWKKQCYEIALKKNIIPKAFRPIIYDFYNTPMELSLPGSDKLKDKVALVTGGYKGIGLAIVKTFLREGAKVIITGRNEKQLDYMCKKLKTPNLAYMIWDISQTNLCESNFSKANKLFGAIDILVNNAGVNADKRNRILPFETIDEKYFEYIHNINTIGTSYMCKTFANIYDEGNIINIISNTAVRSATDTYFLSKWALLSFTKAFAKECTDKGKKIKINGICPGPIKTDMMFNEKSSIIRTNIPNGRIGLPEEIAELTLMVAFSALSGMNGEIIVCDGGETLN